MKHLYSILLIALMLCSLSSYAYPNLSPYSYCGGNPVNYIDPTGKDIVVLNYTEGEHLAILIQNEDDEWQYYSINGDNLYIPFTDVHLGGRPFNDVAVGSWASPQDFFDSPYNVRNRESQEDKSMNHFGFSEGYHITTTPEQDAKMRNSFSKTAETEYNLFDNNCATAVQKAMIDAGIPVSEPTMIPSFIPVQTPFGIIEVFNGYQMNCDINIMPSSAFKSIKKWNPNGNYIQKQSN
ncbi:MAG: hypothetical protein K1V78_01255 [Muribaculaceae bacterium]